MEIVRGPNKPLRSATIGPAIGGAPSAGAHGVVNAWTGVVPQLQAEAVLGVTPAASRSASCSPGQTQLVAYPAGSTIVVYDVAGFCQRFLLRASATSRQIACTAFAPLGQYLAGGERSGPAPAVLVWDLSEEGRCVQELRAHKHGISSLAFSPDGKLLASTGASYDAHVCLWDWRYGTLLCKQRAPGELRSCSFTEDSASIICAGRELFKTWSISSSGAPASSQWGGAKVPTVALAARGVALKEHARAAFVDVCAAPRAPGQPAGAGGIYALTSGGLLLQLRATGRSVDRSVDVQVRQAHGLAVAPGHVAVACAGGIVRVFATRTLVFRATLPRAMVRGGLDLAGGSISPATGPTGPQANAALASTATSDLFPDAVSASYGCGEAVLAVAYTDRSLVVWDVRDYAKVCRVLAMSGHGSSVWDVAALPAIDMPDRGAQGAVQRMATCAGDGTIRIWGICEADTGTAQALDGGDRGAARELHVMCASASDAAQARDTLLAAPHRNGGTSSHLPSPGQAVVPAAVPVMLRCLRASPDGRHLATGDQRGNLRVFDAATLQLVLFKEAHDAEILCCDYSAIGPDGGCLLASGSRDTLIHLYDAQRGYERMATLDDHTAAVTGVRFAAGGKCLVSVSADRSIKFRIIGGGDDGGVAVYSSETTPRSLLYDVAVDPLEQRAVTVGQDGTLRVWQLASGSLMQALGPEPGAGLYAITCHADGWMRLWDLTTGRLAAKAGGDGDMVTAACVSPDCSRLVSVGGDGCVCIWRLPASESRQMAAAAARIAAAKAPRLATPASPGALHAESHSAHATAARRAAWEPGFTSPASAAVLGTTGRGDNAAISQTLLRVRQGRPLVPAEFLPRWAQGSTLPQERDTLGENAAAAGEGAAVGEPPCPAAGQAPCSTWGADAAGGSGAAIPAGGRWAEALARELPVYDEKGRPVATLKAVGAALAAPGTARAAGASMVLASAESLDMGGVGAAGASKPCTSLMGEGQVLEGVREGNVATDGDEPAPAGVLVQAFSADAAAGVCSSQTTCQDTGGAGSLQAGVPDWQQLLDDDDEVVICPDHVDVSDAGMFEVQEGDEEPMRCTEVEAGSGGSSEDGTTGGTTQEQPGVGRERGDAGEGEPPAALMSEDVTLVRRDLYKEHFGTLCTGHDPAAGSPNRHDERRQSLSARYRLEQARCGRLMAGPASTSAFMGNGTEVAACPGTSAPGPDAEGSVQAAEPANGMGARMWRHGKMEGELQRMRERLASLQTAFQAQAANKAGPIAAADDPPHVPLTAQQLPSTATQQPAGLLPGQGQQESSLMNVNHGKQDCRKGLVEAVPSTAVDHGKQDCCKGLVEAMPSTAVLQEALIPNRLAVQARPQVHEEASTNAGPAAHAVISTQSGCTAATAASALAAAPLPPGPPPPTALILLPLASQDPTMVAVAQAACASVTEVPSGDSGAQQELDGRGAKASPTPCSMSASSSMVEQASIGSSIAPAEERASLSPLPDEHCMPPYVSCASFGSTVLLGSVTGTDAGLTLSCAAAQPVGASLGHAVDSMDAMAAAMPEVAQMAAPACTVGSAGPSSDTTKAADGAAGDMAPPEAGASTDTALPAVQVSGAPDGQAAAGAAAPPDPCTSGGCTAHPVARHLPLGQEPCSHSDSSCGVRATAGEPAADGRQAGSIAVSPSDHQIASWQPSPMGDCSSSGGAVTACTPAMQWRMPVAVAELLPDTPVLGRVGCISEQPAHMYGMMVRNPMFDLTPPASAAAVPLAVTGTDGAPPAADSLTAPDGVQSQQLCPSAALRGIGVMRAAIHAPVAAAPAFGQPGATPPLAAALGRHAVESPTGLTPVLLQQQHAQWQAQQQQQQQQHEAQQQEPGRGQERQQHVQACAGPQDGEQHQWPPAEGRAVSQEPRQGQSSPCMQHELELPETHGAPTELVNTDTSGAGGSGAGWLPTAATTCNVSKGGAYAAPATDATGSHAGLQLAGVDRRKPSKTVPSATPGGVLGLLQRMKVSLPGIKSRPSASEAQVAQELQGHGPSGGPAPPTAGARTTDATAGSTVRHSTSDGGAPHGCAPVSANVSSAAGAPVAPAVPVMGTAVVGAAAATRAATRLSEADGSSEGRAGVDEEAAGIHTMRVGDCAADEVVQVQGMLKVNPAIGQGMATSATAHADMANTTLEQARHQPGTAGTAALGPSFHAHAARTGASVPALPMPVSITGQGVTQAGPKPSGEWEHAVSERCLSEALQRLTACVEEVRGLWTLLRSTLGDNGFPKAVQGDCSSASPQAVQGFRTHVLQVAAQLQHAVQGEESNGLIPSGHYSGTPASTLARPYTPASAVGPHQGSPTYLLLQVGPSLGPPASQSPLDAAALGTPPTHGRSSVGAVDPCSAAQLTAVPLPSSPMVGTEGLLARSSLEALTAHVCQQFADILLTRLAGTGAGGGSPATGT